MFYKKTYIVLIFITLCLIVINIITKGKYEILLILQIVDGFILILFSILLFKKIKLDNKKDDIDKNE